MPTAEQRNAGGTVLSGRPRVSGRRRRASKIYSDRRLRDEHGHRQHLRSRLEACRPVLHGFASARNCSAIERGPVGLRNCDTSGRHTKVRGAIAQVLRQDLAARGPATPGRAEAGKQIAALGNAENESFGIELGYAYPELAKVCSRPNAEIPGTALRTINSRPFRAYGSRVLFSMARRRSTTGGLVHAGGWGVPPSASLLAAAERHRMPLSVLRLDEPESLNVFTAAASSWCGPINTSRGADARAKPRRTPPAPSWRAPWDGRGPDRLAA